MKIRFLLFCFLWFIQSSVYADEKITVLLDWFANPSHAPLFVAEQQCFFKAEQLDVKLLGPADPADPPKLVAAGKADIAITYEPQFIEQVDQHFPLISIGTLIDRPLNCLAVLKNGPIKSIADLKKKRVGHSVGAMGSVILKTMLEKNGLTLADVESINVHYDLTQALLTKRVDAVTGIMRTFEVIQLDLAGHPARIFLPEKNGVPNYSELIFVVNKTNLHDPKFKKFLIAVKKGRDYLAQHPEETWQAFAKSHPELNDELNHRAWFATLPYFAKQPGYFNTTEWQNFIDFMHKNNLIQTKHLIKDYIP